MAHDNIVELIMKLKDELSGPLGRFETRFKRLADNIKRGALVIGGALVGLMGNSVRLAASFEETEAKFEAVFKEYGPAAREELERISDTLGRSSNRWLGYAAMIQDTLVPLGWAREDASELSVELVQLAADLSSFNDIPMETVISDLQGGLVGNIESLRKYGIVAKDLQRNSYALANEIWDGTGAMTAQQSAAATLGIIYESTADAQGDAARTADSFTNTMRSAGDMLYDFQVELGQRLLPVIAELVKEHMPGFIDSLENIVPPMVQFVENVVTLTDAIANLITEDMQAEEATEHLQESLDTFHQMLVNQVAAGLLTAEEATTQFNEQVGYLGSTLPTDQFMEFAGANGMSTAEIIRGEAAIRAFRNSLADLTLVQLENLRVMMTAMSSFPGFGAVSQAAFEQLNAEVTERLMPSIEGLGGLARSGWESFKTWGEIGTSSLEELGDESESTGDALEEMGNKGKEAQERMAEGYSQLEEFLASIAEAEQIREEAINARYDERIEQLNEIAEIIGENEKIIQARYDLEEQREQELEEIRREARREGTEAWRKEQDAYRAAKEEAVGAAQSMSSSLISSIEGNITRLGDGLLTLIDEGEEAADDWREAWWKQIKSLIVSNVFKTFAQAITGWIGGILSIFDFKDGGEVLHAQSGLVVPSSGPFGDLWPAMLERGEHVYTSQEVNQGMIPGSGHSILLNFYNQPTLSTASPSECVILADAVGDVLMKAGYIG